MPTNGEETDGSTKSDDGAKGPSTTQHTIITKNDVSLFMLVVDAAVTVVLLPLRDS
jgi:hypothetical protein